MILACHHISKSFPEKTVLDNITFHLEKGDKTALVGINGAGKTTLLKIMIGQMEPDSGTVTTARDTTIGYLAQDQGLSTENTIYQEMLAAKKDIIDMEAALSDYERQMADVKDSRLEELMNSYNTLMHRFDLLGGFSYKSEITGVLNGLGFAREDYDQRISTLSGGQKTRVALGKMLLQSPDIIFLDEPTNHLDITSIRWLENYLSGYKGTVLIVSHDRYFLDRTVNHVIELSDGKATVYQGSYSDYSRRRQELLEEQKKAYLNNQAEIRHQEEVIARLRRFNREKSIKRAESREKMLQKMEVIEKPREIRADMHLQLTPAILSGKDVLHVENLSKAFGENRLFSDVSFDLRRGEHVAVIGGNGTGKTTLMKILNGLLAPDSGLIRLGTNVHIGYYDQEHHELDETNTVFEEIAEAHPSMNNTSIRNLLASFLFTGDDVFKSVADLSGGEKGRLSLAKLMLSKANLLFLDEPTNHLDIISKEVLENALNGYEGTVLYISHDRYFMNHTASRILSLTNQVLLDYPGNNPDREDDPRRFIGNYDYYLEKSAQIEAVLLENRKISDNSSEKVQQDVLSAGENDWKTQKEKQARIRKNASDLKKCEEQISGLEAEISSLEAEMALPENCTDVGKLRKLSDQMEEKNDLLTFLYEEWDQLAAFSENNI